MGAADFSINGSPSADAAGDRLFAATAGQTLTCTLEANPTTVLSTRFDVLDASDPEAPLASKGAPQINWTSPGTPAFLLADVNDDALIDMPADGVHAYIIRCTVSTVDGPVIFERVVAMFSIDFPPLRKTVPAESTQARARGHSDDLNDLVDAVSGLASDKILTETDQVGEVLVSVEGNVLVSL